MDRLAGSVEVEKIKKRGTEASHFRPSLFYAASLPGPGFRISFSIFFAMSRAALGGVAVRVRNGTITSRRVLDFSCWFSILSISELFEIGLFYCNQA